MIDNRTSAGPRAWRSTVTLPELWIPILVGRQRAREVGHPCHTQRCHGMSTALTLRDPSKEAGDGLSMPDDEDGMTLFSLRRPRNVTAGASSGLKSIAKGVAMGAVGLVAAPAIGAKEGGAKGFVQGLGAGIVSAICLPVAGVVVGSVQVTRGLFNTPEAIKERASGKVWDEDTRSWIRYDLDAEAREILKQSEEEWCKEHGVSLDDAKEGGKERGAAVETELYDVLGVKPSATQGEIKKAYYKLAREKHPDKSTEPDAHATFQALGEAYQVLSNEETRDKYDKQGKAALDMSTLDSTHFFSMLFGSAPFEYLVGELKAATMMSLGMEHGSLDSKFLNYKQKRREVVCALTLKGFLKQFECGDEREFEEDIHRNAQDLVKAPMGEALLWTVGYMYEQKGLQALGGVEGFQAPHRAAPRRTTPHHTTCDPSIRGSRSRCTPSEDASALPRKSPREQILSISSMKTMPSCSTRCSAWRLISSSEMSFSDSSSVRIGMESLRSISRFSVFGRPGIILSNLAEWCAQGASGMRG